MAYFLASIRKTTWYENLIYYCYHRFVAATRVVAQNKYTSTKGYVSFFSKAPVADVDAKNEKVKVEMNTSNGEVIC